MVLFLRFWRANPHIPRRGSLACRRRALYFSLSHDRVTVTFASSFSLIAASRSSTKRSSGGAECHSAFLVRHVPDLARVT